mmetsp:Transcript_6949/g.14825  ORF Transcript_6949/g.14825 Transcript_6949/m.14825 type:complete len:211 (+) Transcript_6949:517-1149(+)
MIKRCNLSVFPASDVVVAVVRNEPCEVQRVQRLVNHNRRHVEFRKRHVPCRAVVPLVRVSGVVDINKNIIERVRTVGDIRAGVSVCDGLECGRLVKIPVRFELVERSGAANTERRVVRHWKLKASSECLSAGKHIGNDAKTKLDSVGHRIGRWIHELHVKCALSACNNISRCCANSAGRRKRADLLSQLWNRNSFSIGRRTRNVALRFVR